MPLARSTRIVNYYIFITNFRYRNHGRCIRKNCVLLRKRPESAGSSPRQRSSASLLTRSLGPVRFQQSVYRSLFIRGQLLRALDRVRCRRCEGQSGQCDVLPFARPPSEIARRRKQKLNTFYNRFIIIFMILNSLIASAKMKVLTLNTGMNMTRDGALPPRAKQLVKVLNSSSYDIICLQGRPFTSPFLIY